MVSNLLVRLRSGGTIRRRAFALWMKNDRNVEACESILNTTHSSGSARENSGPYMSASEPMDFTRVEMSGLYPDVSRLCVPRSREMLMEKHFDNDAERTDAHIARCRAAGLVQRNFNNPDEEVFVYMEKQEYHAWVREEASLRNVN